MDNKSLAHTKWNCTYHIVIIPKYRRKVMYGAIRQDIRQIIIKLCKMQNVELIEGAVCADHVHLYVCGNTAENECCQFHGIPEREKRIDAF
jgi:putative transposase